MDASLAGVIISSVLTFAGVVVTVLVGNRSTTKNVKKEVTEKTDLTLYRIQELEKKQDKHNTLIERMYKLEDRVNIDEEKIRVANHRIDDLEAAHK